VIGGAHMMYFNGNNYGMMGYGFGWVMMIGILILIVLGIIALIKYIKK
jgi:uncharacterized membrane protein